METLCLIAAPRTGINHLCAVLRNFPELAAYQDVFGADGALGADAAAWPMLRKLTGIEFERPRDPALAAFAQAQPTAWLDALEQVAAFAHKRVMSFKLMPQQLPDAVIEREVLPRHGLRAIIVMRKQVDAYISWRKAVELGRTREVDTTGMRIVLDADHFARWLDEQQRWYERWRDYLQRRFLPCPVIRYDLDIDQPVERVLRRFAAAAAQVGATLKPPATITHPGFTRQDRAKSLADKVTNWADFNREIFARGLERRAFGYPI